jgi:pimeloyl-ACP methyl ester carboxylesterase
MLKEGMYLEVLERRDEPHTIVVVFEGTNFSELPDWQANLRWFLRFIPGFKDQYTLAAQDVAREFFDVISSMPAEYRTEYASGRLLSAAGKLIRIVTAGHSLGGGLAQHFAYAFKQEPLQNQGPKVSEVFAFDSSPVTGWFSVSDPPRSYNAKGLMVNRIFEHGEILAYIRRLIVEECG